MSDPPAHLAATLHRPRYEIIPMRGVEAQLGHLPPGSVVTVTASPTRGMAPTLELAATVAALGHRVVPHLSARLLTGERELARTLDVVGALGIEEVFVIAGDAREPAGDFHDAGDLLEAMAGLPHAPTEVGISGYPEPHPTIPDQDTIDAMTRKAPHATYIVSQICYEPAAVRAWIAAVRARGVDLPIHVGLPGVIDRARLLRLSLRVGLGDSVRYLSKQSEVAGRLLGGYQPDELVEGLADLVADPGGGIAGWHLFTFNEIARTEDWRRQVLATTQGVAL